MDLVQLTEEIVKSLVVDQDAVSVKEFPTEEDNVILMGEMSDGSIVEGEHNITLNQNKINRVFYTEEEIAKALGTTKSYISKILLGKIKSEKYCIEKLPTTKIKVPKKCKVNDLVLKKYKYLITPCLD